MLQQLLVLVRGIPGSGKSTVADLMSPGVAVHSADDYFMINGEYIFDPKYLGEAHSKCQKAVALELERGRGATVANTFTQRWEMEPYLRMASMSGARVVVVDCFDGGMTDEQLAEKNVHGVPLAAVTAMRNRYEHDWRSGDPRPPWQRKER